MYVHPRIKPIRLRRHVDAYILGGLLGQYQAEGRKAPRTHKGRLEFTNKNILEHKEFFAGLLHLGVTAERIVLEYMYRDTPSQEQIENFEKVVGKITVVYKSPVMRGNYGYRTYVRSNILFYTFMNILHSFRKQMTAEKTLLTEVFFAKLLTGDGTIDVRTNNREYDYPHVRIKITDKDEEYRKDYAEIMKILGFNPHILDKHISVRASCSLEKLLYLHSIQAFRNTNNWNKLLVSITLYLEGRRHNTHYRFVTLSSKTVFSSKEFMRDFGMTNLRTANDWLNNKEKEGLLVGQKVKPHTPVKWSLTSKARTLSDLLCKWRFDYDRFKETQDTKDNYEMLEGLKIKKLSRKSIEK